MVIQNKQNRILRYLSPNNYGRLVLRLLNKIILHPLDIITAPPFDTPLKHRPIFLLGAPRSGSTLIYQAITDAFDVAYLSNCHCHFHGSPALTEKFFRPLKRKKASDYTSYHGRTDGWAAPSECGEWWYRFFRREPPYVTLNDVDKKKMIHFRRSLLSLTEAASKPVVFKNLYVTLRLEPVTKYIPEALFIIIKRNELDNAHSILAGRLNTLGNYESWWSVPPQNVDQLKKLTPPQQAVEQIRAVNNLIKDSIDQGAIKQHNVLILEYEKFCSDTNDVVNKIENFLTSNEVTMRRRFDIPRSFSVNHSIHIEKKLYTQLKKLCQK